MMVIETLKMCDVIINFIMSKPRCIKIFFKRNSPVVELFFFKDIFDILTYYLKPPQRSIWLLLWCVHTFRPRLRLRPRPRQVNIVLIVTGRHHWHNYKM